MFSPQHVIFSSSDNARLSRRLTIHSYWLLLICTTPTPTHHIQMDPRPEKKTKVADSMPESFRAVITRLDEMTASLRRPITIDTSGLEEVLALIRPSELLRATPTAVKADVSENNAVGSRGMTLMQNNGMKTSFQRDWAKSASLQPVMMLIWVRLDTQAKRHSTRLMLHWLQSKHI